MRCVGQSSPIVAIIDYGGGNIHSITKAVVKVCQSTNSDYQVVVTKDPAIVSSAAKLILPGVGAFGDAMLALNRQGLASAVCAAANRQIPLLGICLGMQLLFAASEESPTVLGLGILSGRVHKIRSQGYKIPHIGWNNLQVRSVSICDDLPANPYVYFVHSYCVEPTDTKLISAVTDYGGLITAAVACDNIQAVQFHPEKSGAVGLKILANFISN